MIKINEKKCIGCGLCVKDCVVGDIDIVDNKASFKNTVCFKCGHCIAICPNAAVSLDESKMAEVKEYDNSSFEIDSETLLNFIKFRRSVRHFKNKDIEDEKIIKIIEAGRYTQTGRNAEDVSYIVVRDSLEKLKSLAIEALKNKGQEILDNLNEQNIMYKRYAQMWVGMHNKYIDDPKQDSMFFNAPAVIVVVSDSNINGSLASSNMELMINTLGLGTFFSGFFVMAAQGNEEIMKLLGIEKNKQIVTCMVVGYPDVTYHRTVPRKPANIKFI